MISNMAASGETSSVLLDADHHSHADAARSRLQTTTTAAAAAAAADSLLPPNKHALRLPSFESLGIASPHPDKPRHSSDHASPCACNGAIAGNKDIVSSSVIARIAGLSVANASHNLVPVVATHLASTLTPPNENNDVLWAQTPAATPFTRHASVNSTEQDIMPNDDHLSIERQANTITPHPTPCNASEDAILGQEDDRNPPWLCDALESLLSTFNSPAKADQTFRILSHALPYPSDDGHIFRRVMSALYERPAMGAMAWINVFHALPGRSSLADLPKSPPTTPGQPLHNEDYFTQKVFDSAVTVSDYHTDLSLLPRSPRPAVPPSSIDIAVVERYIPPTNSLELASMFDVNAPSILVDRLTELSAENGTVLFIYPTRTGARTFAREYLAPILDPLLRTLAIVHSLPMTFCSSIGSQPVIDQLSEHEEIKQQFTQLCQRLSRSSSASMPSTYRLVHATTALVHLQRDVWAKQWWVKQEKERLRNEVVKWTHGARSRASTETEPEPIANPAGDRPSSAAAAEILHQLLEGIEKRPYPAGQTPVNGVEVSVFVVRRS